MRFFLHAEKRGTFIEKTAEIIEARRVAVFFDVTILEGQYRIF